uniref:Phosphatidylinositol transfer protein membrane associated 2 n=1 Tax=Callorhinchus milii TaxID=7868 RepID=A0A4W3IVW9_CALMI
MLIKEYHIPLPMSVEEYRIAQLYMIQKKSREETCGEGSGVEILENRPYVDGPGGSGQYTKKVYHIGMHIPSWFRSILPKAALRVEEESWNAYPYTRTRYTCPFVEKFSIDIETYYKPDPGDHVNVFNLSATEKRQRIVDPIDIVRDPIPPNEYKTEEDPKLYKSTKTGRGPLSESWVDEYKNVPEKMPVMCAYKLCKVEFRYWGMQSKIERFIHDVGLRKVMLRAHRQAWCWQDEWYGLTMEDIRLLERETQVMLAQKMAQFSLSDGEGEATAVSSASSEQDQDNGKLPSGLEVESSQTSLHEYGEAIGDRVLTKQWSTSSRSSRSSKRGGSPSRHNISDWRMQSIARDSEDSSDEEFFDAQEGFSDSEENYPKEIAKWNSNELINKIEDSGEAEEGTSELFIININAVCAVFPPPRSDGVTELSVQPCPIHVLVLVLHAGNILDTGTGEPSSKQADVNTITSVFETVMRVHFPAALGHLAVRLVSCPAICSEAFSLISNLSPYSYDEGCLSNSQDHIALAALPLLATSSPLYQEAITTVILRANQVYGDFIRSQHGVAFCGQICLVGDCVGGILAFDALCLSNQTVSESQNSSRRGSVVSGQVSDGEAGRGLLDLCLVVRTTSCCLRESPSTPALTWRAAGISAAVTSTFPGAALTTPGSSCRGNAATPPRTSWTPSNSTRLSCPGHSSTMLEAMAPGRFDFEVTDFFLFGSPLGLVLALRKTVIPSLDVSQVRPACQQVYNLFHPADPSASRLEPLLEKKFHLLPPITVPRYQRFPLGDGTSALLADTVQSHASFFLESSSPSSPLAAPAFRGFRRASEVSIASQVSGMADSYTTSNIANIAARWWGTKRMDYALYCPDALMAFPTIALPHLFHASYWESTDVVSFLLRQVTERPLDGKEVSVFSPTKPREKWLRKRTHVKIRNVTANHRVNDVIVSDEGPQALSGRFMYGPLDMVTLTGEKVDVHIMTQPPSGEWIYFDTEITNNSGRIVYVIPESQKLGIGMYPVKLVVRGDHTSADSYITVLPKATECVVFSIDGSFAASVSIMGSDPKVRAGAVDVVRHWQDLGYFIIYVTGRPDMQKQKVVAWLAQHNFPHGIVSFCDGLVHDPLRHKASFLRSLVHEVFMKIHAAYGSTKDISVYTTLGLSPSQIFIVGRATKKYQYQCQFLTEGYAAHLSQLEYNHRSLPAKGNSRMVLRKGSFGLPAQPDFLRKRNHLFRTISSQPGAATAPRPERTLSQANGAKEIQET